MVESSKSEIKSNRLHVRFEGDIEVSDKQIFQYHPQIKPLIDEIMSRGWKYRFEDVKGEAIVEVDLSQVSFRYSYYPPRIEELENEGSYKLHVPLGSQPPNVIEIKKVDHFKIGISTKNYWHAASIDPFANKVTQIENPFHYGFLTREEPKRFAEARELYELSKWLFQEKKMEPEDSYVAENYKDILDRFEPERYRFPIRLQITVEDEEKVPNWEELIEGLSKYFGEKGLLMELEKKPDFFERKKPLP
jgi:hypothetical protein